MNDEQLAFDIDGMLHEAAVEAAPVWSGAPLHFTTAYFSPAALDAAYAHWQFLHKLNSVWRPNRMWHRAIAVPGGVEVGDHAFDMFTADLRCEPWKHSEPRGMCHCVGELTYQAICEPHGWHVFAADENAAVEAWHDHVFPRWRELPVVPARLRSVDQPGLSKTARKWVLDHYPEAMQVTGAPVITERNNAGTRHVPGRSPWSGYDLSDSALTRRHEPSGVGLGD
ncbi:hypothetical protein GCM10011376_25640 [Nocardioides flavus (ex Wang et al. 2016)]|uniref:Uncharacterized protein n=1 Tax=Nocardioides flavus (ex Wang et al. 2016) TaxID=2058780 RepID=A0ABQ3HPB4_9ACTN|nr:DUF6349 family protein [Nocardioides flavus (ex Wang et al. 2016)]GHE17954.1 hypothetical protein GCM10011376_25640 [Nocardioides flavus (ex Wang et al. 2016)]